MTPPQPRRIAFIDHTAKLGGGEIALFNLVRHLDRTQYEPVVILFSDGPLNRQLIEIGIETHLLPVSAEVLETRKDSLGLGSLVKLRAVTASLGHAFRLRKLLRELNVVLVHTNSLKSDLIGGVAGRLARLPVIWHVRDRIDEDYLPKPVVFAFRQLCRIIPDFVIANSAATLSTLALPSLDASESVPSGIDGQRLRVVHDGTPTAAPVPPRPYDQPVIGLVGRISPWKGQHIFIRAAADVLRRFPRARFQIVGSALFNEGAYEREIRELVDTLGVAGSVEFLGFRDDVSAVIAGFDVLVHASTSGEPFGQVVIEGMAASKPVVATDGGGIPEIVVDGVTGLLVPMGDAPSMAAAICRLLEDRPLATRMGQLGRQRVLDRFTIDTTTTRVESVYQKLLGPVRPPSPTVSLLRQWVRSALSHNALRGHLLALAISTVALILKLSFLALFPSAQPTFLTFFCAAVFAAWVGGFWVGIEAMVLGAIGISLFILPSRVADGADASSQVMLVALYFAMAAIAVTVVERLHRARRQAESARAAAEAAESRATFLSRASAAFALQSDADHLPFMLAYVANSRLSAWSIVDRIDSEASGRLVRQVIHRSSEREADAQLIASAGASITDPVHLVIRSGTPFDSASADDESLELHAPDPLHREALQRLGCGPFVVLPLVAGGHVLGALTLVRASGQPPFSHSDQQLAAELALRAALVLDGPLARQPARPTNPDAAPLHAIASD